MAHESGIANAVDRAVTHPEWQGAVFSDKLIQSGELNEMQTIARARARRVSNIVAKDGNRITGAAAIAMRDDAQLILTAGEIYVLGDVLPVAQRVISAIPQTGRIEIGVRVVKTWIDSEDDPTLLGQIDGTEALGEPGAAREVMTIAWSLSTSSEPGSFIPVYLMMEGTIIDQTPPPGLDGVKQLVAIYDDDAHGSYIVRGCRVTALGKTGNNQVFSIEEGTANIAGFKHARYAALPHNELETWDIEEVAGEVHTFPAGGSATFPFFHVPMAGINSVLVTKEVTATVTRGAVAGTADALPYNSVTSIIEIKQGATTYAITTSWLRSGDNIDWSPAGAEPAPGSAYTVKLRYLSIETVTSSTETQFVITGGVEGTPVIIGYDFKLPRIDLLCLQKDGTSAYIKGVSARANALPPAAPSNVLPLAEISNSWMGRPEINNNGIRSIAYGPLNRAMDRIEAHERLLELERIKSGIDQREPVAKKGMFADPFISDYYRDAGVSQTAAVYGGAMELAIVQTIFIANLTAPLMLNYTEEVVVEQSRFTGCMKINPYANFVPLPAGLKISPSSDYWSVSVTTFASDATQEFNRGVRTDNGPLVVSSSAIQDLGTRAELLEFLRVIAIGFTIEGFGPGEILTHLTFDERNVLPGGTITANGSGVITGTFAIPSNVPAGVKNIYAEGAGGSKAYSLFVGQGVVNITTLRRVTTLEYYTPPAVVRAFVETTLGGMFQGGTNDNNNGDPLAETFYLPEPRFVLGLDFRLCAIGDRTNNLLVNQVPAENGIPTDNVLAEAFVPMAGSVIGWKSARYSLPFLTSNEREWAFVVKTDDANHALSIASVQGFDTEAQQYLGSQPYTTGVLLSSSNSRTWTPHQDEDLTFRIVAAKFGPFTKTVSLGTFALVHQSDLQVRATVEIPSSECSITFEVVRSNGVIYRLEPYQVVQLTEYLTETVELRAVLTGTEKLSPILYSPVQLVAGEIMAVGTYVCRAFKFGTAIRLTSYLKSKLPAGSSLTMEYDKADGTWLPMPVVSTEALSDAAWTEKKYEATPITATQGRIKITITGGPSARPRAGDLGAAIF